MSILRFSTRLGDCAVLGPGRRAVLWVYGCCFSCKGCIGENYRNGGRYSEISPMEAAEWYLKQNAEGLTISGGEPMLQAAPLAEMVAYIRERQDCGVITYTGFLYEDLMMGGDPDVLRFLGQIDLLVDGPYIEELDWNQPYRGSENQRFLPLTDRYRPALCTYYATAVSRHVEIRMTEQETLLAGVPSRDQAGIWKKIKKTGEANDTDQDGGGVKQTHGISR